ncbi:hypothetical protein, partial [Pseudomonas syringae]|uniref:hypothetical protein n=1 Tax=Pseudomonas syringae TaxID=317 RepID=UPI001C556FC5
RNAKQGRQVEKNRLGNEDGANGLIVQRLPRYFYRPSLCFPKNWRKHEYDKIIHSLYFSYWLCTRGMHKKLLHTAKPRSGSGV